MTAKLFRVLVFTLLTSLLFTNCKKDPKICNSYTQISGQATLVDVSVFKGIANEFIDTLNKYPQLQVYRIVNDQYSIGMHCNVFYKGLEIFTEQYSLFKDKANNTLDPYNANIDTTINISITPTLTYDAAIKIARQNEDFSNTCISYQLGIYDINSGSGNMPKNYKLVWQIKGTDCGYPIVDLDANNGQVYYKFNGIIIN